ncbi:DUF1493 family protein [Scandinavium sp. M-37]|uniref:DUF1493 family protein n=1 Tax=Scandinavium sp. M-37 TaxID=3373077 RepID=UPI0037451A67
MVNNEDVIKWYNAGWNKKGKWPVTIDTSLTTGRYVWAWEAGEEIMDNYFQTFNVDPMNFDFFKYWPEEPCILVALLPKCLRSRHIVEPVPLTLNMLAESARASKWLYD